MSIAEALLGLGAQTEDGDREENGDLAAGGRGAGLGGGVGGGDGDGDACGGQAAETTAAPAPAMVSFADPDIVNADGDTALHVAIATRRVEVAELLLRAGASVRVANRLGFTALHFAAALGLSGLARRLLEKGADVAAVEGAASATAVAPGRSLRGKKRNGTINHGGGGGGVSGGGDGGAAEREIMSSERLRGGSGVGGAEGGIVATTTVGGDGGGGDATQESPRHEHGTSPRRCPAASSRPRSASPRSSQKSGPTTPKRGRNSDRSPSAGAAKKGGRSSNTSDGGGNGSAKDRKKKEGRTPLHYAATNGRVGTARVLLEAGAPVDHRRNRDRESPLFAAAKNGHAGVVELLLEELGPGEVDAPSSVGETPLGVACANGHADVVDQVWRDWELRGCSFVARGLLAGRRLVCLLFLLVCFLLFLSMCRDRSLLFRVLFFFSSSELAVPWRWALPAHHFFVHV